MSPETYKSPTGYLLPQQPQFLNEMVHIITTLPKFHQASLKTLNYLGIQILADGQTDSMPLVPPLKREHR